MGKTASVATELTGFMIAFTIAAVAAAVRPTFLSLMTDLFPMGDLMTLVIVLTFGFLVTLLQIVLLTFLVLRLLTVRLLLVLDVLVAGLMAATLLRFVLVVELAAVLRLAVIVEVVEELGVLLEFILGQKRELKQNSAS